MAMIRATSEGDPQSGQQASIRIEGSDTWLPALVPVHAPRGSRTSTTRAVPVVGCLVDYRFVLSWADMRCRSMLTDASFPAECDGADQRNVAVEDTAAAITFVKSLTQEGRRKLDLGDTDNSFVQGKKTAIVVIVSHSDATTAAASWDYGILTNDRNAVVYNSPDKYVDAVVRRSVAPVTAHHLRRATLSAPLRPSSQMAKVNTTLYGWSWGELAFEWTTYGPFKVRALILTLTPNPNPNPFLNPNPKSNPNANPNLRTSRWTPSTRRPTARRMTFVRLIWTPRTSPCPRGSTLPPSTSRYTGSLTAVPSRGLVSRTLAERNR
eukprot:scaffold16967_cov51-Phaeocystis_antarctica.AAC.1